MHLSDKLRKFGAPNINSPKKKKADADRIMALKMAWLVASELGTIETDLS